MSLAKATDLVRLAMMATGRQGVTLTDVCAEFGCSERTAQRWTAALVATFPAMEQSPGDDRRMRWRLPSRALAPLLTPSAEELVALSAAIAVNRRAKGTPDRHPKWTPWC